MPGAILSQFGGIVGVKIRTYTTTYPAIVNPWHWNPNSLQPMDFNGYNNAALVPQGFIGNVFDKATGITPFTIGTSVGGTRNNGGSLYWRNNRLRGFTFISAGQRQIWGMDYPCTLGVGINTPLLSTITLKTYPAGANTGAPDPRCGNTWETVQGAYIGGEVALVQDYNIWQPNTTGVLQSNPGFSLGFSAANPPGGFQDCIPFNGTNWVRQGGIAHNTDFLGNDISYNVAYQNPTGFDVNNYIGGNGGSILATYFGFLIFNPTAQTINGTNLNGFGILIKPDFSSYVILQIIPTDVNSGGWLASSPWGKFDMAGNLWLKNNNNGAFITVSTEIVSIFRNLPVFPPIALPPAMTDTEEPLTLFRGTQNGLAS